MKKKLAAIILVLALTLSCYGTFAACTNGSGNRIKASETFTGIVSKEKYRTEKEAAVAFLESEVSGDTTQAEFVKSDVKEKLSEKQIDALSLTETEKRDLISVKQMTLTYRDKTTAERYNTTCYMLEYPAGIAYMTPLPEKGEPLTKSYYDSVWSVLDKYETGTVTITNKTSSKVTMTDGTDTITGTISATSTVQIRCDESSMYVLAEVKMKMTMRWGKETMTSSNEIRSEQYYIADEKGDCVMAMRIRAFEDGEPVEGVDNKTWYISESDLDFSDQKDESMSESIGDEDYTYFKKTATGFDLQESKKEQFSKKMLEEILQDNAGDIFGDGEQTSIKNWSLDFSAIVSEGCIAKITVGVKGSMSVDSDGVSGQFDISESKMEIAITDLGKTSVTIPKEVQTLVDDFRREDSPSSVSSVTGTYLFTESYGSQKATLTIELKSDGNCILKTKVTSGSETVQSDTQYGTYTVNGNTVTIVYKEDGYMETMEATIKEDKIIWEDMTFIKQNN